MPMDVEDLRFNDQGLIPAICVDSESNKVLMLAYMNLESLQKTIETGLACYYSRSRGSLWTKGESSGHFQKVEEILTDCDQDTILLKVKQLGPGACHEGYFSCFHYPILSEKPLKERLEFDPSQVYGDKTGDVMKEIYQTLVKKREKAESPASTSTLTNRLEEKWSSLVENLEDSATLREKMAELLYSLLELWASCKLHPKEVLEVLQKKVIK